MPKAKKMHENDKDSKSEVFVSGRHQEIPADPAKEFKRTTLAAGAVLWRGDPQDPEVALIHRPRYDDWSWPKGKLDPGETLPECAVRELREEVRLELRPGIPLCVTAYEVPGKRGVRQSKEVWYWAAEVDGQRALPDGDEVDEGSR